MTLSHSGDRLDLSSTLTGQDTQFPPAPATSTASSSPSAVELHVVIVLLSLMSVVGASGNALVLCVFSRKREEAAVSTVLIIALAVVDLVTCLVVIPYTVYMETVDFRVRDDVSCKIYQFLITSNIPFSAQIMVVIAVDRYFCICHPFLRVFTVARVKIVIAGLALFATALGLCVALMFGVYRRSEAGLDGFGADLTYLNVTKTLNWGQEMTPTMEANTVLNAGALFANSTEIQLTFDDPIITTISFSPEDIKFARNPEEFVNIGQCIANDLLISEDFQYYYQKLYTAMYPVCLGVVIILYILIYRSVLARRNKRQLEKSKTLSVVQSLTSTTTADGGDDGKELQQVETDRCVAGDSKEPIVEQEPAAREASKRSQKGRMSKAESTRLANLKTAAMLFVVTVVFVVTFLPAFLMVLHIVPNNVIVFYLYFANNVANPVIYSFMNRNFRGDLIKLVTGRR